MYKNKISYFSNKTVVVGTQKNRLNETVLLSAQNMLKLMGKSIFTSLRLKACLSEPGNIIPQQSNTRYFKTLNSKS